MPIPFIAKYISGQMDSKRPDKSSLLERMVHNHMEKKAAESLKAIKPFIKKSDNILDIGLGNGTFAGLLKKKRYKISGIDVVNLSLYKDIQPELYDGRKLPYKKNQFDVALLISVLHHTGRGKQNLAVLKEAMRVAKRVIVIEDSYRHEVERKIISLIDQISNWEFWRHPYLTNEQWFAFINKMGWRTIFAKQYTQLAFGMFYAHYCLYVLEEK